MASRYRQVIEGDWEPINRRGYKNACCDCGMVHRRKFRVRKGVLEEQVFVDNRATAGVRRGKGVKVGKGWLKIRTGD